MAVIVYKCTGCNRLIQLRENERGLTTIGLCTITQGCKGELVQIDRIQNATTPRIAETIPGIERRRRRDVVFNFRQAITSNTWTIVHNLGVNPVVQVAVVRPGVKGFQEIEPLKVEIIDKNAVRVLFDRAEAGIAQLLARSSAPPVTTTTTIAGPVQVQLTTSRILTIATIDLITNPLPIQIIYIDNGVSVPALLNAIFPPEVASPWSDADTVVLHGREYKIRTIDIGTPSVDLSIDDGSSFYFDDSVYPTSDMFLPLSQSPFANVDKIKRQVIFPEGIGAAESLTTFTETGAVFYAVDTLVKDVYPPVFVV